MAVLGSSVDPRLFLQDYSGFTRAAEIQAQGLQNLGQSIAGGIEKVGDYFKEQGNKKKLIKQSDVQIDAALKLFPDLAPTLQGVRDQIRDENVPLDDRAAVAESVAGLVNMGVSSLRDASSQLLKRQQLEQDAAYKGAQLQIAQQNANSRAATALAAGQQPPKTITTGVPGGEQTFQWDADSNSYVPLRVSGMGDGSQAALGGSLLDIVKRFEGFNPNAYDDYKQTSVGYGTKGTPGEVLTEEQASKRLEAELSGHAKRIQDAAALKGVLLNQNQFNALTSFDYNTGKGADLIRRFGDKPQELAAKMLEYNKAGGEKLRGLENRRQVEAALFLSPVEAQTAQPQTPIGFTPAAEPAVERGLSEEERIASGLPPGSYTGKFEGNNLVEIQTLPQPPKPGAIDAKVEALQKARDFYAAGDKQKALDLLNSSGIRGLFGGAFTLTDLPEYFGETEQAPNAPTPAQGERPPLNSILPNVGPR